MKRLFIVLAIILLVFMLSDLIVQAEESPVPPPDLIVCESDFYAWVDYLCQEGRYGHNNSYDDITSLDCIGTVGFIYDKMGIQINWQDINSNGVVHTKLSEAKVGDIVVYINPNPDSSHYGEVSHVGIYLGGTEVFQASSPTDNMVTMTRTNKKSWSNVIDFRCSWTGDYKDWGWGQDDESAHPDNIYIIHVSDIGENPIAVQKRQQLFEAYNRLIPKAYEN